MSWIGGKKALRDLIVSLFPLYYKKYIEVFGGAGWVLFHKAPGRDFEIFNDFNGLLLNLYRCVQEKPEELKDALRYALNSRENFNRIKKPVPYASPIPDVEKAAAFYQLIRYSYASGLTSFGGQPHNMAANFSLIDQSHARLKNVVLERRDCIKLIRQHNQPDSFFYCDPPYIGTEAYYQNIGKAGFTRKDHIRLRDTLMKTKGKFLLSYNDCDMVKELYDHPGIQLIETSRLNNIKQRYEPNCRYKELLIGNYDLWERIQVGGVQMGFLETEDADFANPQKRGSFYEQSKPVHHRNRRRH